MGYIFPFSRNDKVSPPSTVGGAGLITNNGTRAWALGAQLFLKQDTYEITAGYGHGNLDYSLYGIGIAAGNAGLKLPLEQTGHAFFVEALRRIVWKIFLGPRFLDGDSFLTLRPSSGQVPPLPPDLGLHTALRSLGVRIVRDTRNNHFYPLSGSKLEFTGDFFAQALGSKYSFQRYKLNYDKFVSLNKRQVLAYDAYVCDTGGQPPFYGNCIYGTAAELRGYVAGRYIDRHMFATQLEYRLFLPKRFGVAGFAGVGEVVPGGSQIFRSNQLLPAVGGGPRFVLSSKYHVNLRADFARGKDSWTWSMGVGEAF
ncbi:MAG: BamA/TamA family outer membrane protein [Candidatus Angelobacter sp.]